jgi:hypothetical protein
MNNIKKKLMVIYVMSKNQGYVNSRGLYSRGFPEGLVRGFPISSIQISSPIEKG